MKRTIYVDYTTECKRPETAVARFIKLHPECKHWEDELLFMFTNGTEYESNEDALGKKWTFAIRATRDENTYTISVVEREPSTAAEKEPAPENVAYYEERGCDMDPKYYDGISDINNHRIVFFDIPGKDGKTFIIELGEYTRRLRGIGVKKDRLFQNRLHACLEYENENGCWGIHTKYCDIEFVNYRYTREGVLRFLNAISSEHYTHIQPRRVLTCKNHYKNFTPEGIILHIVKDWKKFWTDRNNKRYADEYKAICYNNAAYIIIKDCVYELSGIKSEKQSAESPYNSDFELYFDRITDSKKALDIIENGIEYIDTITA